MITPTHAAPRQSWPLPLKIAMTVLAGAFFVTLGLLVYVLLKPSDETANGLSISSNDPLALAEYHPSGDSPLVGDHWHASYAIYIGDERQPNAPTWEGVGIHTHGDGIIHIHPFAGSETGSGAALDKWFEYGGGELTESSMREPGQSRTYRNGDAVPGDGRPGEVFVILGGSCEGGLDLEGAWVRVPVNYIPHDGDCIRVMFEPEEAMREHIKNPPGLPSASPTPNGEVTPPVTGSPPP